jgi:Domain of unknown function (DUF5666)
MKLEVGMTMLVLLLVAACSRRELATASYGTELLSGEVSVRDGSPAGVEVSVRGTGMRAVVAEDGQFVFSGVRAEGTQLDFYRGADGIEASLRLDGSGFLSVELTKTTATASAKKSSRRRGVGPTRESVTELEGVIRTASATSLVIFTSKKVEVTVALTPETVIRKGQTPVAAADLKAGMRVHVKAKQEGESYSAASVIVQNDGTDDDDDGEETPPATVREHEGTVVRAGATELVVTTSKKQEVTFVINGDTVIRKGSSSIKPEEIQAGWRVHVKATSDAAGTNTATRVTVQNTKK